MSSATNAVSKGECCLRVLLVDDQDAVRDSLYKLLDNNGFDVLAASNGPDGLAICRQSLRPIELLVTDYDMPQMSGLELARECVQLNHELKVLYVSGSEPDMELREDLQKGGRAFLAKPFRESDLLRKTRELTFAQSFPPTPAPDQGVAPAIHNHGREYQLKVIHQDGTESLSDWIERECIASAMAALRKPQASAFWLRERNIAVATCPLCRDRKTAISEYPLTDWLSPRSRTVESAHSTGAKSIIGFRSSH